jgi:hypothetical protein
VGYFSGVGTDGDAGEHVREGALALEIDEK